MLSYDPEDPFSVADAEALIQKTRVHVADLDMDEAKFKKKLGDWFRSSGRTYLQRLTDAFGGITTPQSTEITDAMQAGYEANDEQIKQLLAMPDFPSFEGHVHAGDFVAARALAVADTVMGRQILHFSIPFDGLSHVKCKKEDKVRGQLNSVMMGYCKLRGTFAKVRRVICKV
eukprot:SAG11_NODE_13047_length_672_cov_1.614311_2_plen_173_part_00